MAVTQERSNKKVTGGRYIAFKKKKQYELGRQPTLTKVGEQKSKTVRMMAGKTKGVLLTANTVNLLDPKTKKFTKTKIKNVIESLANRHYVRRNILTKGAVVETEKGKARITNRPGQEASLNAVLIKE